MEEEHSIKNAPYTVVRVFHQHKPASDEPVVEVDKLDLLTQLLNQLPDKNVNNYFGNKIFLCTDCCNCVVSFVYKRFKELQCLNRCQCVSSSAVYIDGGLKRRGCLCSRLTLKMWAVLQSALQCCLSKTCCVL